MNIVSSLLCITDNFALFGYLAMKSWGRRSLWTQRTGQLHSAPLFGRIGNEPLLEIS